MLNWLTQIFSITLFNLRTIPARPGSAAATTVGIAGVVGVLVAVLAIAEGFTRVMQRSSAPDVAVVLRAGADNEMNSGLTREETRVIGDAAGLARTGGVSLASAELFVVVELNKRTTGTPANVPLRGVGAQAFEVRSKMQIVQGRKLDPGKNEIVVGIGAAREFAGLEIGREIEVGQNRWAVVGLFSADGGVSESEIWTDAAVLMSAYHRDDSFQSVYVKLESPASFAQFKDAITTNPQVKAKVELLSDFYSKQSKLLNDFIKTLGVGIASLMALGALFGALNTMYGAVAARTREIATLRALGFGSSPIILSILIESLALALLGGAIGAGTAYFLFDGLTTATMNWQSFSQVTFAFAVTPALLVQAMIWAGALGFFGGLFPAIRAARIPIAAGLRES